METIEINKALSNETRLNIVQWLKDPEVNFPPHTELGHFDFGVCVQFIQEKAGLSQSTISHFMSVLHNAALVTPTRHGKWTYYKRNEKTIKAYIKQLKQDL